MQLTVLTFNVQNNERPPNRAPGADRSIEMHNIGSMSDDQVEGIVHAYPADQMVATPVKRKMPKLGRAIDPEEIPEDAQL